MLLALMVAGYVVGGFLLYPVWNSAKWGLAAVLAPAHCVLFWYGTLAASDGRYVTAPLVLVVGSAITACSGTSTAYLAVIGTAVIFFAACAGGKNDKSSLL